ncbi:MAG: class II fructose-bisphosphate aldolase [Anaerolineales bacterium]|nr:class II fructose-bisphosphate aldolase [Anaerolineales bacterium]
MRAEKINGILSSLNGSVEYQNGEIKVQDEKAVRTNIESLVRTSVLDSDQETRFLARYLIRKIALALNIYPGSINDLYLARGRGEVPNSFTTPAINLRSLSFYAAEAVFKCAAEIDAGAFIFELARSETGYTEQRPSEYAANILGAAIAKGHTGPVFIQGDHYQLSASRYQDDPESEMQAVKDLTTEALSAGFYNIDIDASTLVDLSKDSIPEQQVQNYELTSVLTKFIRDTEPQDITVSIGGEIGEVGGHNSTEEELRAFLDGYNDKLSEIAPDAEGLSKISIQTGTSHGGVVLPDGSIKEVSVDFETLQHLGQVSRESYQLGGAVQHGASTLPETAFNKFVEAEALEVHLATNFQNILYDRLPDELVQEIHAYLDENHDHERKPEQTDEQFYYKTRKRALGTFKDQIWSLSEDKIQEIASAWETQFRDLFDRLSLADTAQYVQNHVQPVRVQPDLNDYLLGGIEPEDTSDLAD